MQINENKIAFFYYRLFFRIGTFQWVTADLNKKFPPRPLRPQRAIDPTALIPLLHPCLHAGQSVGLRCRGKTNSINFGFAEEIVYGRNCAGANPGHVALHPRIESSRVITQSSASDSNQMLGAQQAMSQRGGPAGTSRHSNHHRMEQIVVPGIAPTRRGDYLDCIKMLRSRLALLMILLATPAYAGSLALRRRF